ncbi:hypothetical protein ACJX0J_035760, partial [Zea mays]
NADYNITIWNPDWRISGAPELTRAPLNTVFKTDLVLCVFILLYIQVSCTIILFTTRMILVVPALITGPNPFATDLLYILYSQQGLSGIIIKPKPQSPKCLAVKCILLLTRNSSTEMNIFSQITKNNKLYVTIVRSITQSKSYITIGYIYIYLTISFSRQKKYRLALKKHVFFTIMFNIHGCSFFFSLGCT